jgi:hypothetical protein
MRERKVVFRLKRHWLIDGKTINIYEEIKAGRKTSQWRDASDYWLKRLVPPTPRKAWFTVGYPLNNLPRLEADIIKVIYHANTEQLEIKIGNVKEVLLK